MKVGLALAGGGVRGAYQVGVYLALSKCHVKIDGFVGTSIGAFNAAMLASGRYKELLSFWCNVDVLGLLGISNNLASELKENKWDYGLVKEGFKGFKDIFYNKGISTSNLKSFLDGLDLASSLYKSKKDYGLVTVRFNDFKPLYLFKEEIAPKLIEEYILASCYLPIFKLEKIIDDNYYLDGGFYDNVPANALLKRGYDLVYAVDLEAIGIKRPYIDKKKVIELKASRKLGSILNYDTKKIQENISLGYYDTIKKIKKLDGYRYIFKVKGNWYYRWLVRNVPTKLKEEMQRFFRTTNDKKLVIKAIEYVMYNNQYSYFKIYRISEVLKEVKYKKKYGVYRFINRL